MKRGLIEAVILIRVILWLLATRLGTLLLCGSLCLGDKWPFINNFSSISLEKREKIVQKWLKHRFLTPIRLAFAYIKVLCLYVFFSWVYTSTLVYQFSLFHVINLSSTYNEFMSVGLFNMPKTHKQIMSVNKFSKILELFVG